MIVRRPVFVTEQPGIVTRHVFSAGSHYDPENLSAGPVIGCDEHVVAPGAGFDWHAHRGVVIVSWVLAGELRHEDADGRVLVVEPGTVLVQATGSGVRHRETNASERELHFVQTTVLFDADPAVFTSESPVDLGGGISFAVTSSVPSSAEGLAVEVGATVLVVGW